MSSPLEKVLMGRNKSKMIKFLENNPDDFDSAIHFALGDESPLCWRTSWLIGGIMEEDDPRIKPYVQNIIKRIHTAEDGHQRELLKILLKMKLDEDFEGLLFDVSVTLWEQVRKQSSVRYYAFQGMMKVVKKYPELKNEILSLTQPHFVNALSPGIRKGIYKSINELKS